MKTSEGCFILKSLEVLGVLFDSLVVNGFDFAFSHSDPSYTTVRLDFLSSPKSQRLFESNRVSNKYQRHYFEDGRIFYVCIRCTYHRSIQLKTGFLALKTHASDVHHYLKQGRVWLSEQVKFVRTRGFREVSLNHTHNVLIAFCLNSSLLAIR